VGCHGARIQDWNTASNHRVGRHIFLDWPLEKRGSYIFFRQRVHPEQVGVYLARHCVPGARLVGGIPIKGIRELPLRSILFAIMSVTGSTSTHLVSRSQVAYGVQCLEPTLFNWSAGFLQNVKEQVSWCRMGQKQFGYTFSWSHFS
jgi:hypothetical protein